MKQVLITGAMSGLWKEMALYALSLWYVVDALDIAPWEMWEDSLPGNFRYIQGDISQVNETLIEKLSGSYDIVVCNAGISLSGKFLEHDLAANTKLMQINTLGHIELIRLLLKEWKVVQKGSIWCVASASEMLPFPIALGYSASKWALRAFCDSLRSYLIWHKISVSVVYPWPMPTAHVKYYGKEVVNNEKSQKKVRKIAKNTFRWIMKWRRNIYPDSVSKILAWFPLPSFILDRVMYKAYKKEML